MPMTDGTGQKPFLSDSTQILLKWYPTKAFAKDSCKERKKFLAPLILQTTSEM